MATYRWVDERLDVTVLIEDARKKMVPEHRYSFWYYWGGIALFLFGIQVVTGILLMVYFRPGAEAHESVRQITYNLKFGWLVRSMHAWSASLMIAAVLIHLFSVFFMKAYRKPREFGWWSGLGLFSLTMIFGFSGYLLPMDDLAYFATKVGLAVPSILPGAGRIIRDLLCGGPDVGEVTNQRFFVLHVMGLPVAFVPLLGFHLWLIQRHGNASPPSEEARPLSERRFVPFFPTVFLKDLSGWLIVLTILILLCAINPWQLGPPANPLAPAPVGIHPEWYFMSQFELLKVLGRIFPGVLGEIAGLVLMGGGLLLAAAVPFFDPLCGPGWRSRLVTAAGWVTLALLALLTLSAYLETGL
jgi:cytochrome b6